MIIINSYKNTVQKTALTTPINQEQITMQDLKIPPQAKILINVATNLDTNPSHQQITIIQKPSAKTNLPL